MWIDTRDCIPLADGYYLAQTVYGEVTGFSYTLKGGWNTRYDHHGVLQADSAVENTYVARWFDAPKPKAVPEEWVDEHFEAWKKGVKECDTE